MKSLALGLVALAVLAAAVVSTRADPGQDQRLQISLAGRSYSLAARVFRPAGDGPFPLVVINHGTPSRLQDIQSMQLGFTRAAQWFAAQGYMVVVALRPGYGASDGPFMEAAGPCRDRDYAREGLDTAAIEAAIALSAATLPGADAQRIVVVGQSAGGLGAIALADAPPPGVVGVISFAGGRGSDDQGHVCGGDQRLIEAAGALGRGARLPQLWLYAANDHSFAPPLAHAMAAAYQAGASAPVRFVDLPAFDGDGHNTFGQADPAVWAPAVASFLTDVADRPAR